MLSAGAGAGKAQFFKLEAPWRLRFAPGRGMVRPGRPWGDGMRLRDLPQVWVLGAVALAVAAGWLWPWPLPRARAVGLGLVLAGLALMVAAAWEMRRARTTVIPGRRPAALVTGGIFRLSRNPIYLGDLFVVAGAAVWAGAPWALPLVPLLARLLRHRFIEAEETVLTEEFGAAYLAWAARTGRWFGRA